MRWKGKETMRRHFEKVSCAYGAPMGRYTVGEIWQCPNSSVSLFRVNLLGDYDDGGAYWGGGIGTLPLYCARCEDSHIAPNARYRAFTRAHSRKEAASNLRIPSSKLKTLKKDGIQ
jgi:hypothetical protein